MQNSDVCSFCNEEKISIFTTKEPRGASTDGRSLAVIFFEPLFALSVLFLLQRKVPCDVCKNSQNAQTKSRQCRGKEEESDTACCIGTPEHCGLVRRDLVVCPPFWLLPRIETGDSFLWACCAPLLRPHPQGNVPAWAFAGRTFRRLWGMSVPFSLSAPLLCQTIVAIFCGNFEQFANKYPAHEKRLLKSPHFSAV